MKTTIEQLLQSAIAKLQQQTLLPQDIPLNIVIERARNPEHGDFASNIALTLAKHTELKPRELAQHIIDHLPQHKLLEQVAIAGPGFINFHLNKNASYAVIEQIFQQKEKFGTNQSGEQQPVIVEFVSCNPTGPLHVGHGRQAAYGDCVARLLAANGFHIHREYYVNDAGRQMDILTVSVLLRYLELAGAHFTFPKGGYKGSYVLDIAQLLRTQHSDQFTCDLEQLFANVAADEAEDGSGNKDAHIDDLIQNAKRLINKENFQVILQASLQQIIEDIREDLAEFAVEFDEWFSEKSLVTTGALQHGINKLKQADATYEKDQALWFNATAFGDEKDRVLVRANGQTTYFASDVAYHQNKFERQYARVIDILGSDHHGYVPRVRAAIAALQGNPDKLEIALVQFVTLYRGEEKVSMSTRSGDFVTLRELRHEVGNDAARYFYIMRKNEQHLDFDLALAKSTSNDNPVYYIQYAHARVCSVMRQLAEKGLDWDQAEGMQSLSELNNPHEQTLLRELTRYAEIIRISARDFAPHTLAHYLRDLAHAFHTYYNAHQFLVDNARLRNARLCLINATRQVLQNGLSLIGISAPEKM
jgi:arginyl-tRNA synthetase